MSKLNNLIGRKFGRLTVIERCGSTPNKAAKWLCKCDCGNVRVIQGCHLTSGATSSCGCYQKEVASKSNITHGGSKTRLYNEWLSMKKRCYWKRYPYYHKYGGRGIDVCDEWRESYENFREWSLANGYSDKLTLDRIDNDKGYSPDNCRWVDAFVQSNNRDFNHIVEYHGIKNVYEGMCRELNVNCGTIRSRMKKHNISFEEAVDNYPPTAPYVNYTLRAKEKQLLK